MAAGFARELGADRVEALSAGSAPASGVNPRVVEAMRESRVDLSEETPSKLNDSVVRQADIIVTMGCGDECPVVPGRRYLDWEIEDPTGLGLDGIRQVRDEIQARVERLLVEYGIPLARTW